MRPGTASRVVLVSALGVFGLGWYNSIRRGNSIPSANFLIGFTITFGGLSFLADFEPEIAGPLALAIFTSDFFINGSDVLQYINGTAEPNKPQQKPGNKRTKSRARLRLVKPPSGGVGQIPGMIRPIHPYGGGPN